MPPVSTPLNDIDNLIVIDLETEQSDFWIVAYVILGILCAFLAGLVFWLLMSSCRTKKSNAIRETDIASQNGFGKNTIDSIVETAV